MANGLVDILIVGIPALILLIVTAEIAVKKILALAHHFGLSATFAGLTIFSISTSLPEIMSHLIASFEILAGTLDYKIASATVLGANIGSNVIQQTFLLGGVVLLMGGVVFKRKFLMSAYLPMIGTTLLCILLGLDGTYSRIDGFILLATFFGYMIYLYIKENSEHKMHINHHYKINVPKDSIIAGLCMIGTLVSAHYLLTSAEGLVKIIGVGGSLIGVLSLGVASAAPELFTVIAGIRQKAIGVSLGTLIGSNIVNPLVAIGGGALLSTYWVPRPLIYWDLAMETISASILLVYLLYNKGRLGKWGAIYLIALYFFYIVIRIKFFAFD